MRLDITNTLIDNLTFTSDRPVDPLVDQIPPQSWDALLSLLDASYLAQKWYQLAVCAYVICLVDRTRLPSYFSDPSVETALMNEMMDKEPLDEMLSIAKAIRIIYRYTMFGTWTFLVAYMDPEKKRRTRNRATPGKLARGAMMKLISYDEEQHIQDMLDGLTFEMLASDMNLVHNIDACDADDLENMVETVFQMFILWPEQMANTKALVALRQNVEQILQRYIELTSQPGLIISFVAKLRVVCSGEFNLKTFEFGTPPDNVESNPPAMLDFNNY